MQRVRCECGGREYWSTSGALEQDPSSILCERYRKASRSVGGSNSVVSIAVEGVCGEFLSLILGYYETGKFEGLPKEKGPMKRLVAVLEYLKLKTVLAAVNQTNVPDVNSNTTTVQHVNDDREELICDTETLTEYDVNLNSVNSSQLDALDSESDNGGAATCEFGRGSIAVAAFVPVDRKSRNDVTQNLITGDDDDEVVGKEEPSLSSDYIADLDARIIEVESMLLNMGSPSRRETIRIQESTKVEYQRLIYERDQARLQKRNDGKSYAYNLLVVGVTGTGKSSSLNTILNRQACRVSGAQAQGTRGCQMQDGVITDEYYVSFIDTQGLGADTSVTDEELLSQIMMSTESISKLRVINNILISFDTNTRATPANMANQLTLMELFGELRSSCFLMLTKWNTNSVQCEWNTPLRNWTKRWRRARTIEEITEEPPTYPQMYQAYCEYIMRAMNNDEDAGAFSKMGTFLSFFQARVLWMYNLDAIEIEDMENGDLDPHIVKLYEYYRQQALRSLRVGSTSVPVEDLTFLRKDTDTLASVAKQLIDARDEKIHFLENIGVDKSKRAKMGSLFREMASENCVRIEKAAYDAPTNSHLEKIASLAGFHERSDSIGCTLQ